MDRPAAIRKIKALRAMADKTTFPNERYAFLAKSDALMHKHDVYEADLDPPKVSKVSELDDLLSAFTVSDKWKQRSN